MTIANARPSRGVEIAWPRPVDFRLSNGLIQYRVRGTTAWITVFSLSDLGGVNEQIVLATLQARGFTVDGDGKLHLTALEQAVTDLLVDLNTVSARIVNPFSTDRPLVLDTSNVFGGGRALYVPYRVSMRAGASTSTYDVPAGLRDARLPLYVRVPLPVTAAPIVVQFDRSNATTTPFVVTVLSVVNGVMTEAPTDPRRYGHIATIWGDNITTDQRWVRPDGVNGQQDCVLGMSGARMQYDPLQRHLYVPSLFGLLSNGGQYIYSPPNGAMYVDLDFSAQSGVVTVYLDVLDLNLGTASAATLKYQGGFPTAVRSGGAYTVVLGTWFDGKWSPALPHLMGTPAPNVCGFSRQDNDAVDLPWQNSFAANLTNGTSLALGFTRGWARSDFAWPMMGCLLPSSVRSGYVFARWYVETDADNAFGTPSFFLVRADNSVAAFTPSVEFSVSARLRIYCVWMPVINDEFTGVWAGTQGQAGVRVYGLQVGLGPDIGTWVNPSDQPRAAGLIPNRMRKAEAVLPSSTKTFDFLVPDDLYAIEGRGYDLIVSNLFGQRVDGRYRVTALGVDAQGIAPPFVHYGDGGTIPIDPARLPAAAPILEMRAVDKLGSGANASTKAVTVRSAALAGVAAATIAILTIGDSISDNIGIPDAITRRLAAMGATVSNIGTMDLTTPYFGDTRKGEGRAGRQFIDYYGGDQTVMKPLPAGQEATYLSGNNAANVFARNEYKRGFNPLLKVATAADLSTRATWCFTGADGQKYIFDVAFYLSRFSLANPSDVYLELGKNDGTLQTLAQAVAQTTLGLTIMVSQIRVALPNARIWIVWNSLGRSTDETRWDGVERAQLRAVLGFVRARADAKVKVLPFYCTVPSDGGFRDNTGTIDAQTGAVVTTVSDPIHYGRAGTFLAGEIGAQFIGAAAAGA